MSKYATDVPISVSGRGESRAHKLVREFHETFGLPVERRVATVGSEQDRELRMNLIEEEAQEFREACEAQDLVGMADALADLLYVTYGAAIQLGIELDDVLEEVHRSNMTKRWDSKDLRSLPPVGTGDGSGPYATDGWVYEGHPVGDGYHVVTRSTDGKVMKPPSFQEPDILGVLQRVQARRNTGLLAGV